MADSQHNDGERWRLEDRSGTVVLLDGVGCRPATPAEIHFASRADALAEALTQEIKWREDRIAANLRLIQHGYENQGVLYSENTRLQTRINELRAALSTPEEGKG